MSIYPPPPSPPRQDPPPPPPPPSLSAVSLARLRRYRGEAAPLCERCQVHTKKPCDMDVAAGIGCGACRFKRSGPSQCVYQGRVMQPRPLAGDPILDVIRHSCDECNKQRLKTCNWLDDVGSRTQACINCLTRNRECLRNTAAPHIANTQVPHATPAAPNPAGPGLLTPDPTPYGTPGNLNLNRSLQPPPAAAPAEYLAPVLGFGQLPGGGAALPAVDDPDDLMEVAPDGPMNAFLQGINPGDGDLGFMNANFNIAENEGQDQMDIDDLPEGLPNWEAQAPDVMAGQARQVHAYMQRRFEKLMKQVDRHIDPQLLALGADPRLGHDPFAPPPDLDNEDLQHQFPPGLDWTATRYGAFKRRAAIQAPVGEPDTPFSPGNFTRLWKGVVNHAAPFPSNVAALASIPTKSGEHGGYRNDLIGRPCEERIPLPGEKNSDVCGLPVSAPVTHCLDRNHSHRTPKMVCWRCNDKSKSILLASDAEQLRAEEVMASRAYACSRCLASGAAERANFAFCGSSVWGYGEEPDQLTAGVMDENDVVRGGFMGAPTPVWGCSCTKLLSTLCQEHRLLLAEAWLTQVGLMNEWILSVFGRKVCPVCHEDHQVGVDAHKFEGDLGGEGSQKVMWACVSCQDFVVVPREVGKGLIQGIEDLVIDVNSYFKKSSELYAGGFTEDGQRLPPVF